MPYIWTEPEIAAEHLGVVVYHTYKDDDINRKFDYHYTTDPGEQEDDFDIRNLPCYNESLTHSEILKLAIESGELANQME